MIIRWNLFQMHCEVTGEFNSIGMFSPKLAVKHQHYQKFMDDLSIQKRCCDHCGKQTKVYCCYYYYYYCYYYYYYYYYQKGVGLLIM